MKRFLSLWAVLLGCTLGLHAQILPGGPGNIGGTLYASNFAEWTVPQGNNGPLSWSFNVCSSVTSGGVAFKPFVVGTPIRIVDANPSLSQTVTVTAVSVAGSGCMINVNPSTPHQSFYLTSATAGLQESLNFAGSQPWTVLITPDFTRLGGLTSTITSAVGNTAVSILDLRSSVLVPYTWNGSVYVAGSFGGGLNCLSGDVTTAGSSGCTAATLATITTPACPTTTLCFDGKGRYVGPQFAFTFSCTAAGQFEIGYVSTNPNTCTYSYSNGTPASATLADSASHTGTISSPWTTGTLAFAYSTGTTFTGNATSTTSQAAPTQMASIGFQYCTFSGLSTGASPTGATASGSGAGGQCASETSTLAGGLGTLANPVLTTSNVGQTYSFATPAGNYPALFLIEPSTGCSRTTSASFTFNGSSPVSAVGSQAVTNYANILGGVQPHMCIYTFGPYSSAVTLRVNN